MNDVEAAFDFYVGALGLKPVMKSAWSAYLLAGDTWLAIVQGPPREHERYDHLAFHAAPDRFAGMVADLLARGVTCWKENESEGDSFYFLDPSGNRFELHATDLEARIRDGRRTGGADVTWYG